MLSLSLYSLADRQGYTPYGYGVDTPVLVRNSVSYGRGWQLLRSRGEKNPTNTTGNCDPPQVASSCTTCEATSTRDNVFPGCMPTVACTSSYQPPAEIGSRKAARATILFVVDANASNLRFFYGRAVRKAYASQMALLVRAVLSLRRVNTTLPMHLLASGEVRVPAVEQRLTQLGVGILSTPEHAPKTIVPTWGSKWARGSFAKFRALYLTSQSFEKVLLLDTDTIVLRNIDHLASAAFPAPAFVAQYKCYPRRELRCGGVMILKPDRSDYERATRLLSEMTTAIYDDLGEGSAWRHLYPRVHELPIGYGALRSTDISAAEWQKVHVLHDPNLLRKAGRTGWKEAGMAEVLKAIDALQAAELRDHIGPAIEAAAPAPAAKAGRSKRGKRGKKL